MIIERQTQAVFNSGIETAELNTIQCTWDSRFLCVFSLPFPFLPFPPSLYSPDRPAERNVNRKKRSQESKT